MRSALSKRQDVIAGVEGETLLSNLMQVEHLALCCGRAQAKEESDLEHC